MNDDLHKRFTIAVAKEKIKQVESGDKQTASKSSIVVELVSKWCDKNGYGIV